MKKQPVTLYSSAAESVALFRRFLEKKTPPVSTRRCSWPVLDSLLERRERRAV
jgi:hypothetical protein